MNFGMALVILDVMDHITMKSEANGPSAVLLGPNLFVHTVDSE